MYVYIYVCDGMASKHKLRKKGLGGLISYRTLCIGQRPYELNERAITWTL